MDPRSLLASLAKTLEAREPRVFEGPDLRQAAVAAILRDAREDLEVLLIRRTEVPNDPWSGHMAFPGGTSEDTDADLLETARRETLEEVGLDLAPGQAELLGRLDDVQAVGRGLPLKMIIRPFVFQVEGSPELVLNREVSQAMWAPVSPLIRGEHQTTLLREYEGARYEMPGYKVSAGIVWGLTYRMLRHLFKAMQGEPIDPDAWW